MPYKTGSRERLYGWKPKPQGNGPRMENRKPKNRLVFYLQMEEGEPGLEAGAPPL